VPERAQFRPAQSPKGIESTSRTDEFHLILVCAREERAKPIGDRRAGRWSPAERGRGGSGARPLAAPLLPWTGAGNVGTGGRSCGAFDDRAEGGEGAVCQWHTVGAGRTGPGPEGLVGGR
jgi:hypothetical protein